MAQTHYLQDDITRIEDLINTGLVSGDTIELAGKILTCESNTVAAGITGLLATGTGTIRMLDGGNVDFSGSNPLPSTITIEGGTEENPLPSYGNYGYIGRAAAYIKMRGNFYGHIISHCNGNSNRPQYAKVTVSSTTSITLDTDMGLENGDVLIRLFGDNPWQNLPYGGRIDVSNVINSFSLSYTGARAYINEYVTLATCGFCIENVTLCGEVIGDELGLIDSYLFSPMVKINRLVFIHAGTGTINPGSTCLISNQNEQITKIKTKILITPIMLNFSFYLETEYLYMTSFGQKQYSGLRGPSRIECTKGCIISVSFSSIFNGPLGIIKITNPIVGNYIFSNINASCEIKTIDESLNQTKIYRNNSISTLVKKSNFPYPAAIPEAWQLVPNNQTYYAWHDEEQIVAPGRTLVLQWYCFIGAENTESCGVQILDGDYPGFGQSCIPMNFVDTLAEYILPANTPVLQWLPPKQLSWRNNSDKPKKVVLRGWAKGGQAYSRIAIVQGGAA